MQDLAVSIAVVCFNEEEDIKPCLDSLLIQQIGDAYEIIIVDNNSTDSTAQIIKEYASLYSCIRFFNNPDRKISKSRQISLREAKAKLLAFVDADCVVPFDWLGVLLKGYHKYSKIYPKLAAVGGGNIFPKKRNMFQKAASIVLSSFWGSHTSTQGRLFKEDRLVRHIPTVNILYNREVLLGMGGFDEDFGNICEDVELNHRLSRAGYKFVFLKDSFVWHNFAPNLWIWIKRVFAYGKGRVWIIKKHPSHLQIKFLLPPLLIIFLIISFVTAGNSLLFRLPLIYFPLVLFISVYESLRNKKLTQTPLVFLIYVLTHLCYGLGEFYGIFERHKV